jgi:hypothetical protein
MIGRKLSASGHLTASETQAAYRCSGHHATLRMPSQFGNGTILAAPPDPAAGRRLCFGWKNDPQRVRWTREVGGRG